jgi:cell division protein FtsQ
MLHKRWVKISLVVLVIGYLSFAVKMFAYKSDETICPRIRVTIADAQNLNFVSKEDVQNLLQDKSVYPIGVRLDHINTDRLENYLKGKSRIKTAECFKTPNGELNVRVTQREPILRVKGIYGDYYVDSERKMMPTSTIFTAYVPIATGYVTKEMSLGELGEFALFLRDHSFWNAQIEQIDVAKNGEVTLVPRVGDQLILMGTLENYQDKLDRLYALYVNGFNKIGWNKYKQITLKYEGQVVCTKR